MESLIKIEEILTFKIWRHDDENMETSIKIKIELKIILKLQFGEFFLN